MSKFVKFQLKNVKICQISIEKMSTCEGVSGLIAQRLLEEDREEEATPEPPPPPKPGRMLGSTFLAILTHFRRTGAFLENQRDANFFLH
jgi:hypothetical protein